MKERLDYFSNERSDVLGHFIDEITECANVVDVGGGAGGSLAYLSAQAEIEEQYLIDLSEAALADAKKRDPTIAVIKADLNDDDAIKANVPTGKDLYLLLDVLEHLIKPEQALAHIVAAGSDESQFIISLPNVRDLTCVAPLLFKGDWKYTDSGVLDRTHLRFFTLKTMHRLLSGAGLNVVRCVAIRNKPRMILNMASLGLLGDFTVRQYAFLCTK